MRGRRTVAILVALAMTGCSVRVGGQVLDARTHQPIPGCAVTIGSRYERTDADGRYLTPILLAWDELFFLASGYEPKTVKFAYSNDRDTTVNVELTPRKPAAASCASRPPSP